MVYKIIPTQLGSFSSPIYPPIGSMYGIFTYIYRIIYLKKSTIHVCKHISPMDPMGLKKQSGAPFFHCSHHGDRQPTPPPNIPAPPPPEKSGFNSRPY